MNGLDSEVNNQQTVGFDRASPNPLQLAPGTINPATGQPFGTLGGGLMYAGAKGAPITPYRGDFNDVQPRVSFTYKASDRISLRTNYGRSYLGLTTCCSGVQQDGFSQTTNIITSGPLIGVPITILDSPFPSSLFPTGFLQPVGSSLGLATRNGQGFSFRNPDMHVPYTDQGMIGVNLELPWRIGLDVAYVGSRVKDLPMTIDLNLIPITEQQKAIARLGGNMSYLSAQLANPFAGLVPGTGLNTATTSRLNLLRPYPLFAGAINEDFVPLGYSTYRGLEISANQRLGHGLAANVNYSWTRRRQATSLLNSWDAAPFDDLDPNDRPHNLTITALYMLPFGPGQAIGRHTTGFVAQLIQGWQFNVIGEIRSGTPIGMNSGAIPLQKTFSLGSAQSLSQWFDASTAAHPRADGTYAWAVLPANDFRVAPLFFQDVRQDSKPQWSISFFKSVRAGQSHVQFRAECFNLFNARVYGGPISTSPTNANFGVVSNSQINFPRTGQIGLRVTF